MSIYFRFAAKVCAVLLITSMFSSCASIIGKGGPQSLNIRSTPDQATVAIFDEDGIKVFEGKTPTITSLEKKKGYFRGKTYTIKISKEGFSERTMTVDTSVGGWYLGGNLVFGLWIGWLIVDPLTGAMWTLDHKEVDVELDSVQQSKAGSAQLGVVLLQDVPDHLRGKMAKITR